ncbi:MAG: PilZ domain-containing protein [Thermodesulfobacteriota bacterium]
MSSPRKYSPSRKNPSAKKPTTKKGILAIERRKFPRFYVELPLDYSRKGKKSDFGGFVKNASEGGILVYLPEKLEVGELLKIEVYLPKRLELNTIKGVAKVVWADLAAKESWREHRYGLSFQSMSKGAIHKLKNFLQEIKEKSHSR